MQDYFLFIDTETSGLPKSWKVSYTQDKNWPHIIQIAWVVYDKNLIEVDRKNYFIENDGFKLEKSSQKIHHITTEYLQANGKPRAFVMNAFHEDIKKYKPLIIGHFVEFDYHMINVEFQRLGIVNVLQNLTLFCTMKASKPYVRNPEVELLKLNQFYFELFNEEPKDFHNALFDALNTAKVFFHLFRTGEVNFEKIEAQQEEFAIPGASDKNNSVKKLISRLFSI